MAEAAGMAGIEAISIQVAGCWIQRLAKCFYPETLLINHRKAKQRNMVIRYFSVGCKPIEEVVV